MMQMLTLILLRLRLSVLVHKIICSCSSFTGKNNQKLSKLLSKWLERSVYWKGYKTKWEKSAINEYRYFLESNFVGVNRLFV